MPEVAARFDELDADLALGTAARLNIDHTAFALFVSDTVDQEDRLTALNLLGQRQEPSVDTDGLHVGDVAERPVFRGASIDAHRDRQRQAPAAAVFVFDFVLDFALNSHGIASQEKQIRPGKKQNNTVKATALCCAGQ